VPGCQEQIKQAIVEPKTAVVPPVLGADHVQQGRNTAGEVAGGDHADPVTKQVPSSSWQARQLAPTTIATDEVPLGTTMMQ